MPEVVRRQGRLQTLYDVILPLGAFFDFPLLHAMGVLHQAEPDALEASPPAQAVKKRHPHNGTEDAREKGSLHMRWS